MKRSFDRYELKYILPVRRMQAVMSDLAELAAFDENGGAEGYSIESLYYDSPELDFFWAKIEGIKFRRKLRIRTYRVPGGRTELAMVEIKQRMNRTVQKRRVPLPLEQAARVCQGEMPEAELDPDDQQVVSEVRYMVRAMHLKPTAITAYHRRAFVGGPNEPSLRVTFDTECRGRLHSPSLEADAENFLILPPDWGIMEVKVDRAIPDFVTSLLARHNCQIGRVSKYCAVVARGKNLRVQPATLWPDPEASSGTTALPPPVRGVRLDRQEPEDG